MRQPFILFEKPVVTSMPSSSGATAIVSTRERGVQPLPKRATKPGCQRRHGMTGTALFAWPDAGRTCRASGHGAAREELRRTVKNVTAIRAARRR